MRILDKKDRRVITDEIENSLFGIKFGRKTADITYGISRPRATLYCRKANKDRGNFLWIAQKRGFRDVAQVFIWLEIAVRCRSAGVNDLSGMRSWSKWVIFSRRIKSSNSVGPRLPARREF